jgi:hypothetical protein
MINFSAPDLTKFPPRGPRVRLGGYVHLPRLLDKARAEAAGTNGEYHYNCPLDKHFFNFTAIDPEALLAEVKKGKSDTEMLAWVDEKAKRLPFQVAGWSAWLSLHVPGTGEGHEWFGGRVKEAGPERSDVQSFFDLLDLDDYVSFGGKS